MKKKQRKRREEESRHHAKDTANAAAMLGEQEDTDISQTEEPERPKGNTRKNQGPSWISRFGAWARRNSPAVIAALTAILVFIGATQAFIYNDQLSVIRKDQRPWIKLTMLESPPLEKAAIQPRLTIVNIGKTPAKSVAALYFLEKVRANDSPKFDEPEFGHFSTGVMFPNDPLEGSNSSLTRELSEDEVSEFEHKDIFFVFYSTITYNDVFGISHWTKYCAFIFPIPPPVGAIYNAKACTDYNDTDNN